MPFPCMAGQPKKRALLAELQRRVNETYGEDAPNHDAFDYVEVWLGSGKTLKALAEEMSAMIGLDAVMYDTLRRHLESLDPENATVRLSRARARGAHAMVEDAVKIADDVENAVTNTAVAAAKLRSDTRLRVAEMFNRELSPRNTPAVQVNIQGLFLDALRRPVLPQPANVTASASAEEIPTVECEVIESRKSLPHNDLG